MLAHLHPIAGAAVLLLLGYVASLGLRLRRRRRDRARLAGRHARLAPLAYGLVLAAWASGWGSTRWLRDDLEPGGSLHFRLGSLLALLLTGSALTAWWMQRSRPQWREVHPWLGAGAALLAAAHAVAGLRIMP